MARTPQRFAREHNGLRLLRKQAAEAGFTLIEVMVAVAIAAVTVAGLYGLFTIQSRQLVTQDLHMEMNQNLRFATDMITRSIRMAGYGTSGYVSGVMGTTNPASASDGTLLPVIVPWDANGSNGTDAITLVYADPSLVMDTKNDVIEACNTTSITFRQNAQNNSTRLAQYAAGDLLICFDYADMRGMKTFLWDITGVTGGVVSVSDNTGLSDYDNNCGTNENLTPVMTCSKANVFTFYVDDNEGDGIGPGSEDHPVLMLDMDMSWPDANDVPLVDDIEDLQFEYCLEDPAAGSVDCTDSTNWVDGSSITPSSEAHRIWMVRMGIISRSAKEEFADRYPGSRPALANRSGAASASDHYFRQVLTTEVSVRNLRYQANL